MATEASTTNVKKETEVQASGAVANPTEVKVLSRQVGLVGTIGITIYVMIISVLLIYLLIAFWPLAAPDAAEGTSGNLVSLFWWRFNLNQEIRLFLIVAVAGAIGGQVHSLRSLFWYVGNRKLVWSWTLYYILVPLVSACLGITFYLVIRGGFFSPSASVAETSPYGFAALSALVGMFSQSAAEKLKEVADTLLKKPPQGEDSA